MSIPEENSATNCVCPPAFTCTSVRAMVLLAFSELKNDPNVLATPC
jgi:uncharacterized Zn finger protein